MVGGVVRLCRISQRAGRQVVDAAGVTGAVGRFIHGAQGQFFTPRIHAKADALGFNKRPGEFRESAERGIVRCAGQPAGEGGRPAAEMFAEKFLLRVAALCELVAIQLMLVRVGFLGSEHAHEFEFETNVILTFAGIGGDLEAERAVERGEVC